MARGSDPKTFPRNQSQPSPSNSSGGTEPPEKVIGPTGKPLTIRDLPSPKTRRWGILKKAEVVAAVSGGLISLEEACDRYCLSIEELCSWQRLSKNYGIRGLRATRLQLYRDR